MPFLCWQHEVERVLERKQEQSQLSLCLIPAFANMCHWGELAFEAQSTLFLLNIGIGRTRRSRCLLNQEIPGKRHPTMPLPSSWEMRVPETEASPFIRDIVWPGHRRSTTRRLNSKRAWWLEVKSMFLSQDEANTKVRKGNWNSSRSSAWESIVWRLRRKHWDFSLPVRSLLTRTRKVAHWQLSNRG